MSMWCTQPTCPVQIVECNYPTLSEECYSARVSEVVAACLTKDPEQRPDAIAVGALLAGALMEEVDHLREQVQSLQRRLDREKEKAHKCVCVCVCRPETCPTSFKGQGVSKKKKCVCMCACMHVCACTCVRVSLPLLPVVGTITKHCEQEEPLND